MAVQLKKDQAVDLTRTEAVGSVQRVTALNNVIIGLGWDAATLPGAPNIDLDLVIFMLGRDGRLESKDDVVFFQNLNHSSGSLRLDRDNRDGKGVGDDEKVYAYLDRVPEKYERLVVVASIYEAKKRGYHFGLVENAFVRVVNAENGVEFCHYDLTDDCSGHISVVFGELKRRDEGGWRFSTMCNALDVSYVAQIAEMYGLPAAAWRA